MKRLFSLTSIKRILLSTLLFVTTGYAFSSDIAIIYKTDPTSGNDFASLLSNNGFSTSLIEINDVVSTSFDHDLIIIDSNTLHCWNSPDTISYIQNSNKPILGLGRGGYNFFGGLNLDIGAPYGSHGSENTINVLDTTLSVFKIPNQIDIPASKNVRLYWSTYHTGIYIPTIPNDVFTIARTVTSINHYLIVQQQNRYILWGFRDPPSDMTQMGKDLFVNIVTYMISGLWVSVSNDSYNLPTPFKLFQNYPNPFNASTMIKYKLSKPGIISLSIYNSFGQVVVTLVNEYKNAGYHSTIWDARNVSSGLYFYHINAVGYSGVRKCLILK